jgi:hypothetical protein
MVQTKSGSTEKYTFIYDTQEFSRKFGDITS